MSLHVQALKGPDDARVTDLEWRDLLTGCQARTPSLTREWHRSWWAAYQPDRPAYLAVRRAGQLVALAPWFVAGNMVFAAGVGTSDALDVLGNRDLDVFSVLLNHLHASFGDLVGVRLHFLPADSPSAQSLPAAAARLGFAPFLEEETPSPIVELEQDSTVAERTSMRRHEARLRREGVLSVEHLCSAEEVLEGLPAFFDQHQRRWSGRPGAATFDDPRRRAFFVGLVEHAGPAGWLRFTRLSLDGCPVAYHFGANLGGRYLWYVPSYEPRLAPLWVGEVLLRQVFLRALEEGATVVDLGCGSEPYKERFSTHPGGVVTLAAYGPEALT